MDSLKPNGFNKPIHPLHTNNIIATNGSAIKTATDMAYQTWLHTHVQCTAS